MGDPNALIADARKHKGLVTGPKDCANFVSVVFEETGNATVFGMSGSVPTIVGRFSADQQSTDQSSATGADLIVFGNDDHIMIYSGNGLVVGTSTGADKVTKVVEVPIAAVRTGPNADLGFSKVLHTDLTHTPNSLGPPDLNPIDIAGGAAGAVGTMFAWVPGFALNAGVLLFAAVLVFMGLREVVSDA